MKKLPVLLIALTCGLSALAQQQPFEKYGYKVKIATLSKGKYVEHFDQDTIVQIGTVMFNRRSGKIVSFVEYDTIFGEYSLQPELISRWMSPDPLAEEFYNQSPYNFANDNPVNFVDPDGMAAIGLNEDGEAGLASTFIKPDGTIIEHRDDNDFGIYVVSDENAWAKGGKTSEGLPMVGIENRAYPYIPGQKINLMDKNQNIGALATGAIDPDYTIESFALPLLGWMKALRWGRVGIAADRLLHIFGQSGKHQLGSLLAKFGGSQEKTFLAVQKAANEALKAGKLTPNAQGILPNGNMGNIIKVGGLDVRLIGGRVKDGEVVISSFSRRDL